MEHLPYTSTSNITLYSDGGSQNHADAGAACIVENSTEGWVAKLAAYLGSGTNNEAEISASLLGFSFLSALVSHTSVAMDSIRWVSDSEYALKSATQYIWNWQKNGWKTASKKAVKNQGLWRSYLALTKGMSPRAEHVKGHSGHIQNEACDEACNWVRTEGVSLLEEGEEGTLVSLSDAYGGVGWLLLDGRDFLANVRNDNPPADVMMSLREKMLAFNMCYGLLDKM